MSSNRSTSKHQSEKARKSESDSAVPSSLRDPPSSAGGHHTNLHRVKYERPLTSNDRDMQPDRPRPKSSMPLDRDSAGHKPPSAERNGRTKSSHEGQRRRTSIDEKTSEAEPGQKPGHASLRSDDEETEPKSATSKRKNKNKTPSSATRPESCPSATQGSRRRSGYTSAHVDSNPQPYVLQADLRKDNNYYLYCLGKIYDVTDMRRRKQMQYWNLLARQRQLGFHSPKEYEVYRRYLSRPRTAEYSTTYSGQPRTKSTDARRRREESDKMSRTASAADGKGKTLADDKGKDQKESCGDRKGRSVSSKTRPVSSMARPVSSKPRLDSSKEGRREAGNQRHVSREEVRNKEMNRVETTDEEIESSQNDEEKENRRNSQSGRDERKTGEKGKPSFALTSKAVEAGNESDKDESSDSDESDRKGNIPHSDDGVDRPVDATNSGRRNTEVASSDDGDSDSESNSTGR